MGVVICQACGTEHRSWTGACEKCGSSQVIRVEDKADRLIDRIVAGRYRIVRKLGQGGMGSVYVGELVGIGQRVALKFLHSDFSLNPEIARRFLNEAKSYARVNHPNAVILHDFGQDEDGNLYISMELVEGVDLKKLLAEQGRLPVGEAIEITLQVADVLAHAHRRGVIHRDLKPENIMVRRGTRGLFVKVLDFGIARMVDDGSTRITVQGAIAGTPRYMAPEQAEGKEIDGRVDVYSLGMVLLEILTGVHPFDGASVGEILRKQIMLPTPHIQDLAPDLELGAIDEVIQKATAKKPGERYATMEQFAESLGLAVPLHLAKTETALGGSQSDAAPTVDETLIRTQSDSTALAQPSDAAIDANKAPTIRSSFAKPLWVSGVALLVLAAVYLALSVRPKAGPDPAVKAVDSSAAASSPPPAEPKPAVAIEPAPAADSQAIQHATVKQEQMLWRETFIHAKTEFLSGRLSAAKDMLALIPIEHADEDVRGLSGTLQEIDDKLARAKSLSSKGECSAAIKVYQEILRLNPSIKEAQDGRRECQRMLTPATLE